MLTTSPHKAIKRTRTLLVLLATGLLAMALTSGCEKDLGKELANRSPDTGIFLEGPLDTVSYAVKLFWWGQDSDGEVMGFYYRWTCEDPASLPDTNWVFTTAKSGEFILPVPNGFAVQTFWVKAADNDGSVDPTPASQNFPVRNAMPSVEFTQLPADLILPAATFAWMGTDPDGDNTIAYYVFWLDGKEDSPIIVAGQDTTIGPDYIGTSCDSAACLRTAYVRAVDEANGASPLISYSWHVIKPVGHVLLVDDVPSTVSGASAVDAFYRGVLDSLEGSGQYTVFDLGDQSKVKSPREVALILALFRQVVWYGDARPGASASLQMGEQGGGIASFLDGGGKIFLEGKALLGDGGSLSAGFAALYLGVDSLRTHYISQSIPHSTNWDFMNGWVLSGNTSIGLDSLKTQGNLSANEIVCPSAQAEYTYYVPPGRFAGQTENYYVGTLVRGGSFSSVCVTVPILRCNGFGDVKQEVAKLLTFLGVGQ